MMALSDIPEAFAATGPTPDPLAGNPRNIDPDAFARFDVTFRTLCSRMGLVAETVNAFTDPTLREWVFYKLVNIINQSGEPSQADVIAVPQWGDAPVSAAEIGKLASWICDDAPSAWRDSIQPGESTVDAAIRFLADGDKARAALLLVRRELVEQGGFPPEQAEGDLIPLIRELAADAPISPEVEELALRLKAQAEPGETAVQVALRLMRELQLDKPDERGNSREAQPDSITAAVDAYKRERGL